MREQSFERLSALYTRFADEEVHGRSPLYEAISRGVAESEEAAAFLATLPPDKCQQIIWRAGLDLNPLDATDAAQADWLEKLVWPEQTQRRANLQGALKIAATHRPRIEQGDLRGDGLERLCREAPKDATLVIFHTAVLAYVPERPEREAFGERAMTFCDYWIANESPRLLPIASSAGPPAPLGRFLLAVNGSPVAWTDPHGTALEWMNGATIARPA